MFDFLKKKINDFVGTITRKEEKKAEDQVKPEEPKPQIQEEIIPTETQTERQTTQTDIELKIEKIEEQKPLEIEPQIPTMREEAAKEIIEELETERKIEQEIAKEKIIGVGERKPRIIEVKETQPKISQIQKPREENIERIIRESIKEKPESPNQIAKQREVVEERAIIDEIKQVEKIEIEEEREIEELVGETEEGRIKREALSAERKIHDEKLREEVARKVFTEKKEEFLAKGSERDLKPKVGIFSKIKGFFTGEVEIGEKETAELFEQFEMALLESDVSYPTAQALIFDLKKRLIGRKVKTGKIQEEVKKEIAFALASVLQTSRSDFFEKVRNARRMGVLPFIVLFVGPNGMGKTTTIAKVAHQLKKQGYTSVISASDTFRAAAIEQSMHHGDKLGIKVVKHTYGSDPAAVAYDAINHAKSHKLDVVLIDTAGRQETNLNLLSEMQKIIRIVKPNLKVFVAEAIAGTTLVSQVKTFHEKVGVDGIILTKLDCDAKGGGSLSIAYECKLPVYFVGTGQGYDDLLEFNEEWIVKNIMAE